MACFVVRLYKVVKTSYCTLLQRSGIKCPAETVYYLRSQ
jgi:hypothetical protein